MRLFIFLLLAVPCVLQAACNSAFEFKSSYEYLQKQKNISLPESEVLKAALKIAENCNGASARFQKMLDAMVLAGVDHNHAMHFALDYSGESDESVDAFLSLFQGLVLEKKYNLSFYEAFETARYFAESSKGNKAELKKDFLGFLGFCFEDPAGTLLSLQQCRSLSLQYLKLHAAYPKGVFQDFRELFVFLRDQKDTGLPMSSALSLTQDVLMNGPGSKKNFIDAYKYGLYQLNMKPSQSLALAMKLAGFTKNEK